MGILDRFKKGVQGAAQGGARAIAADLGKHREFLEGVCALCALVAAADGTIGDDEKRTATRVILQNPTLGQLYDQTLIETTLNQMLTRAGSGAGRQSLVEELKQVTKLPNAAEVAPYVFLVAKDVAGADGSIGEKEQRVLDAGARILNVDPSQLEQF